MLLDTFAWIEFFQGTQKGKGVMDILRQSKCYTSIVSIAEIVNWCIRNGLDKEYYIKVVEKNSLVLNLKKEIVILAGIMNYEQKKGIKNWEMLDSLICATSRVYKLKLLTGDSHFKHLEDVEFLK